MNDSIGSFKTWPTTLELTADKQLPIWIKDLFGLDERKGGLILGYADSFQRVDRITRHLEATIPNPLYMELFE
jgi:hypothetical protein